MRRHLHVVPVRLHVHTHRCAHNVVRERYTRICAARSLRACVMSRAYPFGKRDSMHHHLLEAISETANVLDLIQKFYIPAPLGGGGGGDGGGV